MIRSTVAGAAATAAGTAICFWAASGDDILQGGSYAGNEGWNGAVAVGGDGNDLINGSSAQGNEGWNGDVLVGVESQ